MKNKRLGWFGWVWMFALALIFVTPAMAAEGARPNVNFDHDQTLFKLTGIHTNVACESCHIKGVFKGTPTTCGDCHNRGGETTAQTKSATHIPTTQDCSVCHKTVGWSPATFSHQQLTQPCSTCHNGSNQTGKPATHIQTDKECGACHKTTAWLPAGMDHSTLVPPATGRCSDCHGKTATGKPSGHIFTTAQCDTCHRSTFDWLNPPPLMDHSVFVPPAAGRCNDCHTNAQATNKPARHIQTSDQCDVCHVTTGWLPTSFAHTPGQIGTKGCSDCHNGTTAKGTSTKHIPVTGTQCDKCHTTAGWIPTSFDHSQVATAGNCANCHNGVKAKGKSSTHISTTNYPSCDTCHTTNAWKPTQFAHQNITTSSNCTTCHDGKNATGRPTTGVRAHKAAPMTLNTCGTCHTAGTAWIPTPMNHTGAASCTSCHVISSTGNAWTTPKAGHIATTGHAQCSDCHTTSLWKPSTFNHQGVTSATNCVTGCHAVPGRQPPVAGTPTVAKVHAIVPMTSNACGTCHSIGVAWGPGTPMNHSGLTNCAACHSYDGNDFTSAKSGHVVTKVQCSLCHTTTAWTPAYSHGGVTASTNCATAGCHNVAGQSAPIAGTPPAAMKLPHTVAPMTSTSCGSCHAQIGTSWGPGTKMNHTGATNCKACHATAGNGYTTPGKADHIAIGTAQCSSCHVTSGWKPATKFNHTTINVTATTNCTTSNCHDTLDKGVPRAGRPATIAKAHTVAPMTSTSCGTCHTIGAAWTPATMKHTGLTSCSSCHVTGGNDFTPTPATSHMAINGLQCSKCHTTTIWKPAYSHTGVTTATNCATSGCHNTAAAPVPVAGKPANHSVAPMTSTSCGTCHAIGTVWKPTKLNHTGLTTCSSCHDYASNPNGWTKNSPKSGHVVTKVQCSLCHTTTAWTPAYSHGGVTASTNCATAGCHNVAGQSAPIAGTPPAAMKLPHTVAPMTSTSCGSCHAQIGTSWGPGTKMNHTGATNCKACHATAGNGYTTPGKADHIAIGTAQCSSCHVTSGWKPATKFNHTTINVTATTNCTTSNCHDTLDKGVPRAGRPATIAKAHTVAPMTSTSCGTCHTIGAAWTPATMKHTGLTSCSSCHVTGGNDFTPTPATSHMAINGLQCSKCHTTTIWKPAYSHTGVTTATNCATSGCHNTAAAPVPVAGKPANHSVAPMTSTSCGTCHAIGTVWKPTKLNHTNATLCSSCHSFKAPNSWTIFNKITNTAHVTTTLQCSSCHSSAAWLPATFKHAGITATSNCTTSGCHISTNTSTPLGVGSTTNPHTVTPMNSTSCAKCHSIGTAWGPGTKMNHTGAIDCKSCHVTLAGNAYTTPSPSHKAIGTGASSLQCSSCHTTGGWLPAYSHSHTGVTTASNCATAGCHNVPGQGFPIVGRPLDSSLTPHNVAPMNSTSCGVCHTQLGLSWGPGTKMNHTGVTNCSACHTTLGNTYTPITKPHMDIKGAQCSQCHTTANWTAYSHTGVTQATNCATAGCHNVAGKAAPVAGVSTSKPHTVAPMNKTTCGSCHKIGGTSAADWVTTMNHSGATLCSGCHTISATKPVYTPVAASHIPTGGVQCSSCHVTTTPTWKPANFKHAGVTAATNCAQAGCHSIPGNPPPKAGVSTTKPHTVVPMNKTTCGSCHTIGGADWKTTMNHTGVTACSSCHTKDGSGGLTPAPTNPPHISTTLQCSVCHTTTNWTANSHKSVTAATNCAQSGCHAPANTASPIGIAGATAKSKPHNVAPMNVTACAKCHTIGSAWGPGTKMNHSGATLCSSCHKISASASVDGYTPAAASHITTTLQCSTCHTTSVWKPASFSHSGITATTNCTSVGCHGTAGKAPPIAGVSATKKHTVAPMNAVTCGSCHAIGTVWTVPLPWSHAGATSSCSSCHSYTDGSNGLTTPIPGSHVSTALQCSTCHKTAAWKPAYSHTGVTAATNCASAGCHNVAGRSAPVAGVSTTKPHTAAPMNKTTCGSCHAIGTVWTVTLPWNHAGATACSTCHSTAGNVYTKITLPSFKHAAIGTAQCSSCHTTAGWLPANFGHTGVTAATNCATAGCHDTAGKTTAPRLGVSTTKPHTAAPMNKTTCGTCHKIGGTSAADWVTTMNHSGATACASCHAISTTQVVYTPAAANHITTGLICSACHNTKLWNPSIYAHAGVTKATNCASAGCHNTAGKAAPAAGVSTTKKHTVAPMNAVTCGSCHAIGTVWTVTLPWNHTGATNCLACHDYTNNAMGLTNPIPGSHASTGSTQCSTCHKTAAWKPATSHVGVTTSSNCATSGCHGVPGQTNPPMGTPTGTKAHTVAPMTSPSCGTCHTIGGTFTGAKMNHTGVTTCTSCHPTTTASTWTVPGKTNHVAIGTSQCNACHTTTGWLPAGYDHKGLTAATNCASAGCHNVPGQAVPRAGTPTGTLAHTVAPMTNTTCGTCHAIGTIWGPGTKMNHSSGVTTCTACHPTTTASTWTQPGKVNHMAIGTMQCSQCHSTTAWKPASAFNHAGVTAATNCTQVGCHNVAGQTTPPSGRPTTTKPHLVAPLTSNTCGSCHAIGATFTGAKMNHTNATLCSSCHKYTGSTWPPTPTPGTAHMSTTLQCSSCHLTTGWLPASFNHQGITAASNCTTAGCHETAGKAAPKAGRPTSHSTSALPMTTSTTCGSCHTIGTSWTPATMNHTNATACNTCHSFTSNTNGWTLGSPKANHLATGAQICKDCHTTTAWKPTSFAHTPTQIGTKTCKDCHNGTLATGPSTSPHNHTGISPAPYNCDACHRTTAWAPAAFGHSGVTTGCTTCHKTGFATTKSNTHFITTQACEKCHTTTVWSPIKSYIHTTTYYKAHPSLSMTLYADCKLCHINNNEVITGAPHMGNAAYKPDCAWCHATQFKAGSHKKTGTPTTVNYTVAELKNCAGACHEYTNNTFTTIKTSRTGHHSSSQTGF